MPDVARSWEVLDGGRRYLFHLRNDRFWSDGSPVTAGDFEWAWKRNLNPATRSETAQFLHDVIGAHDYNLGINPDPESVGVRALDAQTLEVHLVEPVAYFPFISSLAVAFPLLRTVIECHGEEWWQPGRLVSNGDFRLIEFSAEHGGKLERMAGYPGLSLGNIQTTSGQWNKTMRKACGLTSKTG
jgi:oligopeptide transport system substrate-binding protein